MLHEGVTCLREDVLDAQLEPGTASGLEHESLTLVVEGSDEDPRSAVIRLLRGEELIAERSFSPGPPRCPDFHAAIAVTLGIMLRSVSTDAAREPEPQPEPEPEPEPAPALSPLTPKPPRPLTFALRATGLLDYGLYASRARGFAAQLELGGPRWALRVGALSLFSRDETFDEVAAGYATRPHAGTLDACWRTLRSDRWLLDLCAGMLLGRLQLRGVPGPDSQRLRDSSHTWAALRAELDVGLRLVGGLWARLSLSPTHGLSPITATADTGGRLRAEAPLPRGGILIGFGLAYEFQRQGFPGARHR
ncbi:MAG: hypothetical protein ABW352_25435 [Polyangiales bacterium]